MIQTWPIDGSRAALIVLLPEGYALTVADVETMVRELRSWAAARGVGTDRPLPPLPLSPLPSPLHPPPPPPHSPTPARGPDGAPVREASPCGDGVENSSALTAWANTGRLPSRLDYAFRGKGTPNSKGETLPPRECILGPGAYEWATAEGWRGSEAAFKREVDNCLDWFRKKGKRHVDWEAAIRVWIRTSIKRGEDVDYGTALAIARPQVQRAQGELNGRDGRVYGGDAQPRPRTGYGYDRNGNPTNRATSQRHELEKLDAILRERNTGVAEPDSPDVITLGPDDWRDAGRRDGS